MDSLHSPAKKVKRVLTTAVCLMLAVLLFAGCAVPGSETAASDPPADPIPSAENTPPEEPPVSATDTPPAATAEPDPLPPTFPMGSTGEATDGALRCLPLNIGVYCNAHLWGDTVLLYNDRKFQVCSLVDGSVLASAPGVGANAITVSDDYIIYYVLNTQKIVFRDKSLETVKTVDVNVSVDVTEMLFSQDGSKAYYHIYSDNAVVELDIETGEERVIPVNGAPIYGLSGLHFEDTVLRYWGKEGNQEHDAFVDLETGAYLGKDTTMTRFQSWDNGYYICRAENGKAKHLIVTDGVEQYLKLPDREDEDIHYSTWILPQLNNFLALGSSYESPDIILELYDLTTGDCTASLKVDLGGAYQNATTVLVDPSGEYIWLCMKVGNTGNYQMGLYRWDYKANALPSPADPSVAVPAGTPLIGDELAALQDLFAWPSHYTVMSYATFSTPAERSLQELLREGPEAESFEMSEAERAYLSAISEGFIYLDTYRISKDDVIRILDQYYGLTLEDFPDLGAMVYWEETDYFYYCHSDTARRNLTVTHAVALDDGTVWIRYSEQGPYNSTGEMILKPTQDGYQILSNQTSP